MTYPDQYSGPPENDPQLIQALGEVARIGANLPAPLQEYFFAKGLGEVASHFVTPDTDSPSPPKPRAETTNEKTELSAEDHTFLYDLFKTDSPVPTYVKARLLQYGATSHNGGIVGRSNAAFRGILQARKTQDERAGKMLESTLAELSYAFAGRSDVLKDEGIHLVTSVVTGQIPAVSYSAPGISSRNYPAQALPKDKPLVILHTPRYVSDLDPRGTSIVIASLMAPDQAEHLLSLIRKDPFTVLETALLAATATYPDCPPLSTDMRRQQWQREMPRHFNDWRERNAGVIIRQGWPFIDEILSSDERLGDPNYREPSAREDRRF